MTKYRTDKNGKWEIKEGFETLIEPSQEYLIQQEEMKKEMEARMRIENEKTKQKQEIKTKLKNKTATLDEIQEYLYLFE